jgi:gliding motility-associated-like protein
MGFTAAATDGSNRREYVVGRFSAPLTPGEHYRLRFALTNGEVTAFSPAGAAVSGIGVFLSEGAPQQSGLAPIDAACQFQLNAPFYDREWQTVAFSFTAESAWSHFAIGVFAPDSEVEFEVVEGGSPQLAYYFVDDFSLELAPEQLEEALDSKGPGVSEEPMGEGSVEAEPWYVPNAFSPNGDGENDLFLPVVNRGEVLVFEVYSRWGELLHESRSKQDLAWDGNDKKGKPVPQGMYIWKLRMRDESGKQPEQSGMLTLIR